MTISIVGIAILMYLFPALYGRTNAGTFFLIALVVMAFFNFRVLYIKNGCSTK